MTPHLRYGKQFSSGGLHFYNQNSDGPVFLLISNALLAPHSNHPNQMKGYMCVIHVGSNSFFFFLSQLLHRHLAKAMTNFRQALVVGPTSIDVINTILIMDG